jgi:hypothetical protein
VTPRRTRIPGIAIAISAALLGAGCLDTEFSSLSIAYSLRTLGCSSGPAGCAEVGDTTSSAGRGDTIWIEQLVRNALTSQSVRARVRADCDVNVWIVLRDTLRATVPAPASCPDSTYETFVSMEPGPVELRYLRWVVDPALDSATHVLVGQMLVEPRLQPSLLFAVR